jgi:CheY-like chemotaxis protein
MTSFNAPSSGGLGAPVFLLVEDEMMLAMLVEDMLRDLGCDVIKAGHLPRALTLANTAALDGAILDINIDGEMVYPVARALRARGIPFIFSSGYTAAMVPAQIKDVPLLPKPIEDTELGPLMQETFGPTGRG